MYCWDEKFVVVSCVACLKRMYDESFCYSSKNGGQVVSGGMSRYMSFDHFSDSDMGVFSYLLSFWTSLPESKN